MKSRRKAKFGITHEGQHVDVLLSHFAVGYRPQGDFIADMVMPVVTVPKQSDTYLVFDRADTLRARDSKRAPGNEANRITRRMSSGTFYANNYALQYPVTIEEKSNADAAYVAALYNQRVTFTTDQLILGWEQRVAAITTSTSNVGSSSAVASSWVDEVNSDPLGDVNEAIDVVQDRTGYKPNKVMFGDKAWRLFRRSQKVRNIIFGTNNGGGYPSREQVANLLDVKKVAVGGAYQNTANETKTEVLSQIWGPRVLVIYNPDTATIDEPAYAKSFRWAAPGLPNMQVERHPYDTKKKEESIEVGYYQDEKITGQEYSYLLVAVDSST